MTRIESLEPVPEASGRRPLRSEIAEGLRYVVRHPLMRPALLWVAVSNFFGTIGGVILVLFAVRVLHLTAATVGLVFSLGNIGVLSGAMLAPRLGRTLGVGRTLILLSGLSGAAWLFVPLAAGGRAIPFLIAFQSLLGFCAVAANITGISLYQAITPDRMLGRMNASRRFVVWGIMPFGGLLGGVLGSHVGLRPTMWIAAVGATLAFLPMLFSPYRRVVSHADGEEIARGINQEFISAAPGAAI